MTEILMHIAIEDIVANPYQPRLQFNHAELEELAASIKINGLIQPIIVRQSDVFGYELVAGERRLKASQLAGLTKVPAIIKDMSSLESMQQAIVENLQRSDLNAMEEAKAYQALIEKSKMTHAEVATYMGKSRPYISNTIRLLQLPQEISQSIEEGTISAGHARALLALPKAKDQLHYFHEIIEQGLSVRQIEQLVKQKDNPKQRTKNKDLFVSSLEKELSQALGLETKLSVNKDGSGQLHISFATSDELNRVMNKLH